MAASMANLPLELREMIVEHVVWNQTRRRGTEERWQDGGTRLLIHAYNPLGHLARQKESGPRTRAAAALQALACTSKDFARLCRPYTAQFLTGRISGAEWCGCDQQPPHDAPAECKSTWKGVGFKPHRPADDAVKVLVCDDLDPWVEDLLAYGTANSGERRQDCRLDWSCPRPLLLAIQHSPNLACVSLGKGMLFWVPAIVDALPRKAQLNQLSLVVPPSTAYFLDQHARVESVPLECGERLASALGACSELRVLEMSQEDDCEDICGEAAVLRILVACGASLRQVKLVNFGFAYAAEVAAEVNATLLGFIPPSRPIAIRRLEVNAPMLCAEIAATLAERCSNTLEYLRVEGHLLSNRRAVLAPPKPSVTFPKLTTLDLHDRDSIEPLHAMLPLHWQLPVIRCLSLDHFQVGSRPQAEECKVRLSAMNTLQHLDVEASSYAQDFPRYWAIPLPGHAAPPPPGWAASLWEQLQAKGVQGRFDVEGS